MANAIAAGRSQIAPREARLRRHPNIETTMHAAKAASKAAVGKGARPKRPNRWGEKIGEWIGGWLPVPKPAGQLPGAIPVPA